MMPRSPLIGSPITWAKYSERIISAHRMYATLLTCCIISMSANGTVKRETRGNSSSIVRALRLASTESGLRVTPKAVDTGALSRVRYHLVRGAVDGRVAQWESIRFTRGGSLVQSQPCPPFRFRRGAGGSTNGTK